MMPLRTLLVVLIVAGTAAFVVGVSIEREKAEPSGAEAAEGRAGEAGEAKESPEAHSEEDEEETLLGVDVEATPFVVLAAIASIVLAAGAWIRPRWPLLLAGIALAMIAFGALDVREVVHQVEEENAGLAALAGIVAVLHFAAAWTAGTMHKRASAPRA